MASSTTAPAQDARLGAHPHRPPTLIPQSHSLAAVLTWRGRCGQQLMPWTRPAPTPVCRAFVRVNESPPHPASALLHRALPLPKQRSRHTPRAPDRPPTATPPSDPHPTHPTSECEFRRCRCRSWETPPADDSRPDPPASTSKHLHPLPTKKKTKTEIEREIKERNALDSNSSFVLISVATAAPATSCGAAFWSRPPFSFRFLVWFCGAAGSGTSYAYTRGDPCAGGDGRSRTCFGSEESCC
jgi:hypothetical protein